MRTRAAIVDACRELTRTGAEVTMPRVAKLAMVSEATAYRYFPDLITLLEDTLEGLWPPPEEASPRSLAPKTRPSGSPSPASTCSAACTPTRARCAR